MCVYVCVGGGGTRLNETLPMSKILLMSSAEYRMRK